MTPEEVFRRAARINRTPFTREILRLPKILDLIAMLTREAATAQGMTGMDDVLTDIAANAMAWLEYRKVAREAAAQLGSKDVRLIENRQGLDWGGNE